MSNAAGNRHDHPVPFPIAPVFLNRELSWVSFNERVLGEAIDEKNPLLERIRFLTIFYTNLDEFFMIRVSGLKQQVAAGVEVLSPDGLSPLAQLLRIDERLVPLIERAQRLLSEELLTGLEGHDVRIRNYRDLTPEQRQRWDAWYEGNVHPILTPLAVGPTHPFPFISNLSLNLGVNVRNHAGEVRLARVKIPGMLPRLVVISDDATRRTPPIEFLPLEQLVAANLHKLFPGMEVDTPWVFRVTRDADVEIREDEADDLLKALQDELRKRRLGRAVRLEVQRGMPREMGTALRKGLQLDPTDVFEVDGLIGVSELQQLLSVDLPRLKYPPFVPRTPSTVTGSGMFADIRAGDVLLHHPFDAFKPVLDFVREAAHDPKVLAIKQTLYRTSGDSPIIDALEEAVERGKQVAAIVELKARFDEENNILWARRLEEAGVHVVYGVTGLKTHAKLTLAVRQEGGELRRYAHIGTGNYNPITARVYTDLGLFTADPDITSDVAEVFNRLTGFSRPPRYRKLLVAPRYMKKQLTALIRREADNARAGREARIIAKCNAVTDAEIIEELYRASQAGVRIDLLVRGMCGIVPGIPGLSDRISVRSVVGRFLEHSRVYWFANAGQAVTLIGSADWMDRNLHRRVEVLTPVESAPLARWLREVLLERYLQDRARTHVMLPDGSYERAGPEREPPDVHDQFLSDLRG